MEEFRVIYLNLFYSFDYVYPEWNLIYFGQSGPIFCFVCLFNYPPGVKTFIPLFTSNVLNQCFLLQWIMTFLSQTVHIYVRMMHVHVDTYLYVWAQSVECHRVCIAVRTQSLLSVLGFHILWQGLIATYRSRLAMGDSPVSISHFTVKSTGIIEPFSCNQLYLSFRDSNSDHHSCTANTFHPGQSRPYKEL